MINRLSSHSWLKSSKGPPSVASGQLGEAEVSGSDTRSLENAFLPLAGSCVVCRRISIHRCMRCNNNDTLPMRFYCSRKCQKIDWTTHRKSCQYTIFVPLFSKLSSSSADSSSVSAAKVETASIGYHSDFVSQGVGTSNMDSAVGSSSHLLAIPRSMIASNQNGRMARPQTDVPRSVADMSTSTSEVPPKKHYPALPSAIITPPRRTTPLSNGGVNPSTLQRKGILTGDYLQHLNNTLAGTLHTDAEMSCLPCQNVNNFVSNSGTSAGSSSGTCGKSLALGVIDEEESKDEENSASVLPAARTKEYEEKVANLRDNLGMNEKG
jgi:endogenous inhibitor of DNA gyrase (YacG/DUF329 family)